MERVCLFEFLIVEFKIEKSLVVLMVICLLPMLVVAQDSINYIVEEQLESDFDDVTLLSNEDDNETFEDDFDNNEIDEEEEIPEKTEEEQAIEASKKLEELQKELNSKRDNLTQTITDASLLEQKLEDITEEVSTLEGQLKNLDTAYSHTEQRLAIASLNYIKNEEILEALMDEIAILVRKIESQKSKLRDMLVLVYYQSEQVGYFDSKDLQTMKLLLADDMVSNLLSKTDNLAVLEYSLKELVSSLHTSKDKLERNKTKVEETSLELKEIQKDLENYRVNLSLQKKAKASLLAATQGEETLYRALLEKAQEEQESIREEYKALTVIYSEYKQILEEGGIITDDFAVTQRLSWPVPPTLGVSAYFRDPSYRAALGLTHHAIDIRAPQATAVQAPADGIVLKTKGGQGSDYHYIVIGHSADVMTLYGHMFDIFVQPGESIRRGQVIGLSGGLPGSRGAGWLTTGPHLHFEVFKNGVNVDPLIYLNTDLLPERYRPKS